jgi:hypothetical protein
VNSGTNAGMALSCVPMLSKNFLRRVFTRKRFRCRDAAEEYIPKNPPQSLLNYDGN